MSRVPRGVYPRAIWRPVPQALYAAPITPTAAILHSNAGSSGDLYGWWTNPAARGLYSHFQITLDGTVYQYCSVFRRAPANVTANAFAASFETANTRGHGRLPEFDRDVWPEPMRASIIDALDWLSVETGIPRIPCTDGRRGIGGHDWYDAWRTRGHVCPGARRNAQIRSDIIPAVAGQLPPEVPDVTLTTEQAKQLAAAARDSRTAAGQAQSGALYAVGAGVKADRALDWSVPATLDSIYHLELGRPVDSTGLTYWRDKIAQGATVDQVQAAIHDTPEAVRHRGETAA